MFRTQEEYNAFRAGQQRDNEKAQRDRDAERRKEDCLIAIGNGIRHAIAARSDILSSDFNVPAMAAAAYAVRYSGS